MLSFPSCGDVLNNNSRGIKSCYACHIHYCSAWIITTVAGGDPVRGAPTLCREIMDVVYIRATQLHHIIICETLNKVCYNVIIVPPPTIHLDTHTHTHTYVHFQHIGSLSLTWQGHLPAYTQHHFSLCCRLSHQTDDLTMGRIHHRVSIDVHNLVTNYQSSIQVGCTAFHNCTNRCLREVEATHEERATASKSFE